MFHILEDRPELLEILQELIESEGYGCLSFDSAESYLEYFNSTEYVPPIAVLTDYDMGKMNGVALIKHIRQRNPYQKAMIISGTPSMELDRSVKKHLCFFLDKPYRPQAILTLLENLNKCETDCQSDKSAFPEKCHYDLQHDCPFHHEKT